LKLIGLFRLIAVVSQKDSENCRIQLLVVLFFCKLRQHRKSDDNATAYTRDGHGSGGHVGRVGLQVRFKANLAGRVR